MANEVGLSTGEVHEDDLAHAISEVPPEHAPLKITVTKQQSKEEESQKVGWSDVWESIKSDVGKLGDSLVDSLKAGPQLMKDAYEGKIDPNSDEALKKVLGITVDFGLGGIATAPMREGAGMFGGRLSAKANKVIDPALEDMALNNLTDKQVFEKYGVYHGPDNLPRFEISDKGARLKTENMTEVPPKPEKGGWEDVGTSVGTDKRYETPYPKMDVGSAIEEVLSGVPSPKSKGPRYVGDVLHHPELYEHYPWVKELKLSSPGMDWSSLGFYNFPNKKIMVRGNTEESMLSTLLHEVNHAIQHHEGFARGGNPEEFLPKSELYEKVKDGTAELEGKVRKMWKEVSPIVEKFRRAFNEEVQDRQVQLGKDLGNRTITREHFLKAHKEFDDIKAFANPEYGNPKTKGDFAVLNFIKKHYPDMHESSSTLKDAKNLLSSFEDHAYRQYQQLYGEYESRVVQDRIKWNEGERLAGPHWEQEQFKKTYPEGTIPAESVKQVSGSSKASSELPKVKHYEIYDLREKKVVSGEYKTDVSQRRRGRTRADKMNLEYGAHRYTLRPVYEDGKIGYGY